MRLSSFSYPPVLSKGRTVLAIQSTNRDFNGHSANYSYQSKYLHASSSSTTMSCATHAQNHCILFSFTQNSSQYSYNPLLKLITGSLPVSICIPDSQCHLHLAFLEMATALRKKKDQRTLGTARNKDYVITRRTEDGNSETYLMQFARQGLQNILPQQRQ